MNDIMALLSICRLLQDTRLMAVALRTNKYGMRKNSKIFCITSGDLGKLTALHLKCYCPLSLSPFTYWNLTAVSISSSMPVTGIEKETWQPSAQQKVRYIVTTHNSSIPRPVSHIGH